jgi:glycosyltransferase involved in cell wall biosynthesis
MSKPLTFSVGIPTFNQGQYLEETILSLLNQTRPPDEIVISDHYSTDNTAEIIRKYAKHVRGVQPPREVKLAGQYNFTLMSQTSDWITIFCSDDLAHPNYAEVLMRGAARDPRAALVRAGWQRRNAAGAVMGAEHLLSMPRGQKPPDTLLTQRHGPMVCGTSFAIRRDAFHRSGPILASIQSLVDWALFVQMAPFGTFVREPDMISTYRVGHDGDKFLQRLPLWLSDEQHMFDEVFPLACGRANMPDRSWIAKASRDNFLRYLASASAKYAPEERDPIAPLFVAWADRVGERAQLDRFAAGERIALQQTLPKRMKKALRPIAQNLYGRLHRS